MHVRISCESVPARLDAFIRFIDDPQLLAVILEIMRPSSKARRNLQNRASWQKVADARKDGAGPLRGGTAPRCRPFLARLFPVVLHRVAGTISPICIHQKMAGGGIEPPTRGFSSPQRLLLT